MLYHRSIVEMLPACFVLAVYLVKQVTSQLTQPGHKYKVNVYLPEGCGDTGFSGMYGVNLISQRDGTYSKGVDCILHLSIPSNYVFNITFTHFDLEQPAEDGSCSDYLQLYNGYGTEMLLSDRLCGSQIPASVLSNTSVVTLKFHTDNYNEFTGFKLIYDRVEAKMLAAKGLLDTAQQRLDSLNGVKSGEHSTPESHSNEGKGEKQGSSWHNKGAP